MNAPTAEERRRARLRTRLAEVDDAIARSTGHLGMVATTSPKAAAVLRADLAELTAEEAELRRALGIQHIS